MAKYKKHKPIQVGDKIHHWTVLEREDYIDISGKTVKAWKCICDCENHTVRIVSDSSLKRNNSKCCGIGHKLNQYDLSGKFGIGYFKDGDEFYFDIEDFEKIKDYCWHKGKYGYAETTIRIEKGQTILKMHRLIMDAKEDEEVDHIYHHNADNRKSKLRKCSHFENMHNKKLNFKNKTGIPGVVKTKYGKFNAQVAYGENINLGIFDTIEEARDARLKYKEENGIFISNADRGIPD